jgi:hypothetical protein
VLRVGLTFCATWMRRSEFSYVSNSIINNDPAVIVTRVQFDLMYRHGTISHFVAISRVESAESGPAKGVYGSISWLLEWGAATQCFIG